MFFLFKNKFSSMFGKYHLTGSTLKRQKLILGFLGSYRMMFRLALPRRFRKVILCCILCSVFLIFHINQSRSYFFMIKESSSTKFAIMEKIQLERKILIKEKCKNMKFKPRKSSDLVVFYVDDQHRLLYCDVPKVYSNKTP
jgi:hypothetical protein